MKSLKILTSVFTLVITLNSCKKTDTPSPVQSQSNYFPSTAGSFWQYIYNDGTITEYDYATGTTIAHNNPTYMEIKETITQQSQNSDNVSFICNDNGTYHGNPGMFGTYNLDPLFVEKRVFKNLAKVGDSWTDSIQRPNSQSVLYYKKYIVLVKDVGISMVVQNKTYNDVAHFTLVITGEDAHDVEDIDYYVANHVGIIKEMVLHEVNGKSYSRELTSYGIK